MPATKKETAAEKRATERSRRTGVETAIAAVMADMPGIQRRPVQTFTAFAVDDVYATLRPLFIRHGLVLVPSAMDVTYVDGVYGSGKTFVDARVHAAWSLIAVDDGSRVPLVFCAEGRDSQDKATNKAAQQALKYALIQMFLINTGENAEEDPGNGEVPVRVSPEFAAKRVVLKASDGDKGEAARLWPQVLESAGLTEVLTEIDRGKIEAAVEEIFAADPALAAASSAAAKAAIEAGDVE